MRWQVTCRHLPAQCEIRAAMYDGQPRPTAPVSFDTPRRYCDGKFRAVRYRPGDHTYKLEESYTTFPET